MYEFLSFKPDSPFYNVCTIWLCTLLYYTTDHNQLGSHIISHWRSYTLYALRFCRKPKPISTQELGHPNTYDTLIHCGNVPCHDTLVWSVHYLHTLLRYTLPYYSVELYPTVIHCWAISNANILLSDIQPITLLNISQDYWNDELYRILRHCWGIPCLITLLSCS